MTESSFEDIPGTTLFDGTNVAHRISSQHVLHVFDKAGKSGGIQSR
jgi:hypothetical protein